MVVVESYVPFLMFYLLFVIYDQAWLLNDVIDVLSVDVELVQRKKLWHVEEEKKK